MQRPQREPAEELDKANPLSGPAPVNAAFHRRCDQDTSQRKLAPSPAAQLSVHLGRVLEIPTAFWGRHSRPGHEPRLHCLDPDGCSVRTRSVTTTRKPRLAATRKTAGTAIPAVTTSDNRRNCKVRQLDRSLLMGAPPPLCLSAPLPLCPSAPLPLCPSASPGGRNRQTIMLD
jgi:hypothetical protein